MTLFALRLLLFVYLLISAADLLLQSDQAKLPKPVPRITTEAIAMPDWPYPKDEKIVTPCSPNTECFEGEFTW